MLLYVLLLFLANLRIDVARPATFGGVARSINKVALLPATGAHLGWGGGLKCVATVGALPPVLCLFHRKLL
jgi:hypothetical protein